MFSITSSAIIGIEAIPVRVEIDVQFGMSQFTIVGLPDASVKESKDRIRSALKQIGCPLPRGRITVNLAPADIKKQGPLYDLPIAVALLIERGIITQEKFEHTILIGELSLDGSVRSVTGALPTAIMAQQTKQTALFIPKENESEVALVENLLCLPITSLSELIEYAKGACEIPHAKKLDSQDDTLSSLSSLCFSHIKGQSLAKRGLEISAAGGHNILLSGPPGTGKTLLSRSFPSILPPLTKREMIEVTNIASVAGELSKSKGHIHTRPFRAPHHSSSAVSLVGGGSWPKPGEISLAHRGVLFLDELPEFQRTVLEHLRQPLEDGFVSISRANASVKFPARFLLIATMNPCPCGFASDPKHPCLCTRTQIDRYQKRLSGPLLDRFDLRVEVSNLSASHLLSVKTGEPSSTILTRVLCAQKKQKERFLRSSISLNTEISPVELEQFCALSETGKTLLAQAIETFSLSPRACTRVRKVARTIADLSDSPNIQDEHIAEALQFRTSFYSSSGCI